VAASAGLSVAVNSFDFYMQDRKSCREYSHSFPQTQLRVAGSPKDLAVEFKELTDCPDQNRIANGSSLVIFNHYHLGHNQLLLSFTYTPTTARESPRSNLLVDYRKIC
jgi:hypothetical protein